MPSKWTEHVKNYAKEHGCSYKQAMKDAKSSYKKSEKEVIDGGLFEKRKAGLLPPSSRKLLAQVGNEKVVSLTIERHPFLGWFNLVTFGGFSRLLHKLHYDHVFHLSLVINGKYRFEKTQVVVFGKYYPQKGSQSMKVDIPPEYDATIDDMINITRDYMGPERFSNYNVATENCQTFVNAVLTANGLNTEKAKEFVLQDVVTIVKNYPGSKKLITIGTEIAARANRIYEGEGKAKGKRLKHR